MSTTMEQPEPVVQHEYEFDDRQNKLIADLSTKMRFVGYFWILMAALLFVAGVSSGNVGDLLHLIPGVLLLVVGVWTERAAKSFRLVVDSEGSDIHNLIDALSQLRKLLSLQFWVMILSSLAFLCAVVLIHVIK